MMSDPVDLEAVPTLAQLVHALNAVRSVNEATGTYNPTALAALHWGEQAVQEIARLSAEVERLRNLIEAESREKFRQDVELRAEVERSRADLEAMQEWQNGLTAHIPEHYEASEGAQEYVIDCWLKDVLAVVEAARAVASVPWADRAGSRGPLANLRVALRHLKPIGEDEDAGGEVR